MFLCTKRLISYVISLLILQSCTHIGQKPNNMSHFSKDQQKELYGHLKEAIKENKAKDLRECNCMKAFYRDLFGNPDGSARYAFDTKVGEQASLLGGDKERLSILVIGSGTLLNELTALANVIARGKSLDIYLTDWAYVFYEDKDFKEKALKLGNNPDLIPDNWEFFYFWAWAKNKEKPYLPFFENHHRAIDEFKTIVSKLDDIYKTSSKVHIIKPPTDSPLKLPPLDMILSIDAQISLPNLMWNLYYQFELSSPIQFIALNKAKPMGGFFESPDLSIREENSMNAVSIDIYDVWSDYQRSGSFKLVERTTYDPNESQIKNAPEFRTDPGRDSTQSPLDMKR